LVKKAPAFACMCLHFRLSFAFCSTSQRREWSKFGALSNDDEIKSNYYIDEVVNP